MISLSSEITDTKGRRAKHGWVLFDRECAVCSQLARRFRATLAQRGFGLAALQDPRAASMLALPPEEMLRELRVVTTDSGEYGGAAAIVYLAGRIWWAWPLYAIGQWPAVRSVLALGYEWFASHRHCAPGRCEQALTAGRDEFAQPKAVAQGSTPRTRGGTK